MRLALFQPDMPPNVGAAMRLCACLGVSLDIIKPCGFPFSAKAVRRTAMDYSDIVDMKSYSGWDEFYHQLNGRRLILLTAYGSESHLNVTYNSDDILLLGRESAGVPDYVNQAADLKVVIPMIEHARCLNVITAGTIVLSEALRQTGQFPG